MSTKNKSTNKPGKDYADAEFVITREFAAPRELVFKAWTETQLLSQWWGPRGFTTPVCQWDARPGQTIHVVMRAPNGTDYPMGGAFREVTPPERLVFTAGALDDQGKLLFEFLHTVVLTEKKGKTTLTLHSRVLQTAPGAGKYIGGFEAGMTQSLERLTDLLAPKTGPLIVERTYDAPIARVWQALTEKEQMKEWYFDLKEFKPEVGFEFQFKVEHNGYTYDHRCRIVEVVPGQKLVHTWRYEGHEGDSTVSFELFAEGSQTRLKLTHVGLETFPPMAAFARANFQGGWTQIVGASLPEYLAKPTAK